MRESIKIWIIQYCKLYNIEVPTEPVWDRKRKRWDIKKYVTQSYRIRHSPFGYWDKYTQAFNWIEDLEDE